MIKTVRIVVDGTSIQSVGYRRRVVKIAKKLGIFGTVRNVDDGTVEIIGQGEEQALLLFIKEIDVKEEKKEGSFLPVIQVGTVTPKWEKSSEKFADFKIVYSTDVEYLDNISSELDVARDVLINVATQQKETITQQKMTIKSIEGLTDLTDKSFTNMESKYHRISIVTYTLLFTISTFAVFSTLLYLNVILRNMVSFTPVLAMNAAAWTCVIYLTIKKRNVATVAENV